MFVSYPEYESRFPFALQEPGVRQWRAVSLSMHAPWFLLSVEMTDADVPDGGVVRSLCIAWEQDLADMLRGLEASQVKGILCVTPGWQSPTGQWWAREVSEVWIHRSAGGEHVAFADTAGVAFDCGMVPEHVGAIQVDLLIRLPTSA